MKKRHSVTYLKEIMKDLHHEDLGISDEGTEILINRFLDKSVEILLDEGIVDIRGSRFRISRRKLNPMCGKDATYKITANISNELRDQAEKYFSDNPEISE